MNHSTNKYRKAAAWFLLSLMPAMALCRADSPAKPPEAIRIAESYGVKNFTRVDALRFTFNVKRGTMTVERQWTWETKTGQVACVARQPDGSQLTHSYNHLDLAEGDRDLNRTVDAWFINDQYWLLFPFHLVWDSNVTLTPGGKKDLPIPPGTANYLFVQYAKTSGIGYTPGDAYDFFYDDVGAIRQWIFRKGGSAQPTLIATWQKPVSVGPIKICLDHRNADGTFRMWFSDVAVKLAGQDNWIPAENQRK